MISWEVLEVAIPHDWRRSSSKVQLAADTELVQVMIVLSLEAEFSFARFLLEGLVYRDDLKVVAEGGAQCAVLISRCLQCRVNFLEMRGTLIASVVAL